MKIRRIVVRLDPAPRSRVVMDAAAALAGALEAELVGLFVENVDLLHFAGLPFAREIGFPSATRRVLDVAAMERALRARAKQAQELMALVGRRTAVPWSFQIAPATSATSAPQLVTEEDLVVAHTAHAAELDRGRAVRIVRAGQMRELRGALQAEPAGIVVLAGSDDRLLGETLRRLIREIKGD